MANNSGKNSLLDREDDIEDVFTEAENSLMTTIPSNLKQLLIINGYEDKKALSCIDDQVLDSIEEFARDVLPSLIKGDEYLSYYGIFENNVPKFKILSGFRKRIIMVTNFYKTKFFNTGPKMVKRTLPKTRNVSCKRNCTSDLSKNNSEFSTSNISDNNAILDLESERAFVESSIRKWLRNHSQLELQSASNNDLNISVKVNENNLEDDDTGEKSYSSDLICFIPCVVCKIHAMAMSVRDDASLASTLFVLVTDLDSLWTQFKTEDDSHLDCLLLLGKSDQYLYSLSSETRRLIGKAKAVAASFIPTGAEAIDLSYINQRVPSSQDSDVIVKNSPRLPEIPLPKFSGEFREWPAFRDKFSALVNSRSDLSNFEKIYYLMGCLEGAAAEAVQSIPVAGDNYTLVWSTLSERFNRPRLVATSLVEQLLHTSPMTHESLHDLNSFLCTFHENFSLINALKLPDLGSFILFTMAFRCLPVHTRKTFEASNTAEYPSITQLLEFVRSRVAILEVVGIRRRVACLPHRRVESRPASQSRGEIRWENDLVHGLCLLLLPKLMLNVRVVLSNTN
ncbi:hypothetical protein QTP88_029907 [Uroleucon formosanum]